MNTEKLVPAEECKFCANLGHPCFDHQKENSIAVPKDIVARGRNGWFSLREAEIFGNESITWVSFYSKQRGEHAPIEFAGTRKDVARLFKQIAEELEA
jgi:hypothetical protein